MTGLPGAMVEAAAETLATLSGEGHLFGGGRGYATREATAGRYRDQARRVLAAALSVCEVERVRAVRGEDDGGPWTSYVRHGAEWPERDGERVVRLEIVTPWMPAGERP